MDGRSYLHVMNEEADSEELSNLPEVAQLAGGRTESLTLISLPL